MLCPLSGLTTQDKTLLRVHPVVTQTTSWLAQVVKITCHRARNPRASREPDSALEPGSPVWSRPRGHRKGHRKVSVTFPPSPPVPGVVLGAILKVPEVSRPAGGRCRSGGPTAVSGSRAFQMVGQLCWASCDVCMSVAGSMHARDSRQVQDTNSSAMHT